MGNSLNQVLENDLLSRWARWLPRSPDQLNAHGATDAELVALPGGGVLATTVDTVQEEIAAGLYRDPETVGWVAATASLSDLAAVGARPLGLVVAVTLPVVDSEGYQRGIARGLAAACAEAETFVLGGDTSTGIKPSVSGCGVGIIDRGPPLGRVGCAPGDLVFASGPLGQGSSLALSALTSVPAESYREADYRPRARVRLGRALRGLATACIDTSDGVIAALDQLARLNDVGVEIVAAPESLLEERSATLCRAASIPPLAMLAGHHGEFELVFCVRPEARDVAERRCRKAGVEPLMLGRIVPEPTLRIVGPPPRELNGARIRNLVVELGHSPRRYIEALCRDLG